MPPKNRDTRSWCIDIFYVRDCPLLSRVWAAKIVIIIKGSMVLLWAVVSQRFC